MILNYNRTELGDREDDTKIRNYFQEAPKKKIDKFYVEVNHEDPRFVEMEDPYQKFNGVPAKGHIIKTENAKWMK